MDEFSRLYCGRGVAMEQPAVAGFHANAFEHPNVFPQENQVAMLKGEPVSPRSPLDAGKHALRRSNSFEERAASAHHDASFFFCSQDGAMHEDLELRRQERISTPKGYAHQLSSAFLDAARVCGYAQELDSADPMSCGTRSPYSGEHGLAVSHVNVAHAEAFPEASRGVFEHLCTPDAGQAGAQEPCSMERDSTAAATCGTSRTSQGGVHVGTADLEALEPEAWEEADVPGWRPSLLGLRFHDTRVPQVQCTWTEEPRLRMLRDDEEAHAPHAQREDHCGLSGFFRELRPVGGRSTGRRKSGAGEKELEEVRRRLFVSASDDGPHQQHLHREDQAGPRADAIGDGAPAACPSLSRFGREAILSVHDMSLANATSSSLGGVEGCSAALPVNAGSKKRALWTKSSSFSGSSRGLRSFRGSSNGSYDFAASRRMAFDDELLMCDGPEGCWDKEEGLWGDNSDIEEVEEEAMEDREWYRCAVLSAEDESSLDDAAGAGMLEAMSCDGSVSRNSVEELMTIFNVSCHLSVRDLPECHGIHPPAGPHDSDESSTFGSDGPPCSSFHECAASGEGAGRKKSKKSGSSDKKSKKSKNSSSGSGLNGQDKDGEKRGEQGQGEGGDGDDEDPHKRKGKKGGEGKAGEDEEPEEEEEGGEEEGGAVEPAEKGRGQEGGFEPKKVYVGGLPYSSTDDDIYYCFQECGEIENIERLTFPDSGRFRGIAFVAFKSVRAARKALEYDGQQWEGRYLRVQRCRVQQKSEAAPAPLEEPPARPPPQKVEGYLRAFIANVAWTAQEADVRSFFEEQGCTVQSVRLASDPDTGKRKGFGHVDFEDDASLDAAVAMDQQLLLGRPLKVAYAVKRERATEPAADSTEGARTRGKRKGSKGEGGALENADSLQESQREKGGRGSGGKQRKRHKAQ